MWKRHRTVVISYVAMVVRINMFITVGILLCLLCVAEAEIMEIDLLGPSVYDKS